MTDSRFNRLLFFIFWPLTALVLWCDSHIVERDTAQAQWLSNDLAPLFLLLLVSRMSPHRRLQVGLFVPLSALGEILFSLVFGFYHYRLDAVPLYVPFGHSILMSVGLMLADSHFVRSRESQIKKALLLFHGSLIAGTLLLRGDTLSTLFTICFLLLLRRRFARPFYLILGVLVLYVEILGTSWGCWTWRPDSFGWLHTVNPPPGAFTCYVIGDLGAIAIAGRIAARWRNIRSTVEIDRTALDPT
jgi:hypothetical protein